MYLVSFSGASGCWQLAADELQRTATIANSIASCLIRWPASRVALVRRSSEALTGRAEVPAPPPEDAPPPTPVQQVSSQSALLLLLRTLVSVQDDVLMD